LDRTEISHEDEIAPEYSPWFRIALLYFIIAGVLGVLLRYAFVGDLPDSIVFSNIRHAHSHLALLGWIHGGLYVFIAFLFRLERAVYKKLYWVTQFCVLGMLISFSIQGYKFFSIVFVSTFIFLTYYFIYLVIKDLKKTSSDYSALFLKTALFFLFLSSLGTWSLAAIMGSSLKGSAIYYAAIQFYLHFQFNGWLTFGVFALFFKLLSLNNITIDSVRASFFYKLLLISTFLTYALAITWSTPVRYIFWINSLGVILQLAALVYFLKLIQGIRAELKRVLSSDLYTLLSISLLSFIIKVAIQTLVMFPYIATMSYTIRNFVIGFIHLLMLGCFSSFLIVMNHQFIERNKKISTGIIIFVFAVILTEALIFFQGFLLWLEAGFLKYYYEAIFGLSIFIPLGILIYFVRLSRPGVEAVRK